MTLAIVALLGGFLFSAKQLYDNFSLRQEAASLTASETDLNWRYREISATFPQLGIDNDTLRRVTDRQKELLRQQRTPDTAFLLTSRALNEMPNVHLESIEWKLGDNAPAANSAARNVIGDLLKSNNEFIILRGSIRLQPSATPRQTLATFEHFVDLLRVDRNSEVTVLQQPFEIESGRALRGGDVDSEAAQPRQFAIQIARKLAP